MSSVVSNQTDNQQDLFPTTILTAAKMVKYTPIQPHPTAMDVKTHKVPANCPAAYNPDQTQSVLRRNARERNRVKQVNNSFSRLRQHIPQSIITDLTKGGGRGPQKKISKVDTLRIAVEYIRRLQDILEDLNRGSPTQQQQQQVEFRNNSNCDSASNSSFSSSLSTGCSSPSPYTVTNTPIYYTQPSSPLPSLLEANLQVANLSNNYNNSTTLLSPISLNSYSPPHQQAVQLENTGCHSPTSTFNSGLSYAAANFEQNQQPLPVQELQQQLQQNAQTTPPHFDGNLQLKFEPYDNFTLNEEDCTPDDEEILDYISLWQEQ